MEIGMTASLDTVDYAVLTAVAAHDGAWKKRVHDWLHAHSDEMPDVAPVSMQTVGRRIDRLYRDDLLATEIISSDAVNRDLIIAYALTNAGREAQAAKRHELLRHAVQQASDVLHPVPDSDPGRIQRDALLALLCDEFNIMGRTRDRLEYCSTQELLTLLAIHYLRQDLLPPRLEANDRLATILRETPRLRESFTTDTVIERLRTSLIDP